MRYFGFEVDHREGLAEVSDIERFEHMYVLGTTGSGKSTLLLNFIIQELDHCCIVIDPGGGFATKVASLAPKDRLIYIDDEHPLCINLLNRPNVDAGKVAREFTQALNSIVEATSSSPETSVLMRELVRNCARVLVGNERNIRDMAAVLNDHELRKKFKTMGLGLDGKEINPRYDKYWSDFDKEDAKPAHNQFMYKEKRDSAKRVASRLSEFYDTTMLSKFTIGKNQFDVERFVADKKIVVLNLARLDDDVQKFLGNLAVQAVKNYYMNKKSEGGDYLFFYVDEFHLLNVPHWPKLLTQSRKHHISVNVAHQILGDLTKHEISAICGSVTTRVVFPCGSEEAEAMSKIYGFEPKVFINLDKHYAYVRIGNRNIKVLTELPPEIPEWTPPPATNPEYTTKNTEDAFDFMSGDTWIDENLI